VSKPLQSHELYDFGAFRLDAADRALTKNGQVIPLTPKAFDTLVVLVRNSGHVVEKDALLKEVWPDTFVEEGVLAVNVAALRKALSEGEDGRSYIETVPRRGYRFIGEVQALKKPPKDEAAAEKPEQRKNSSARSWALAAGLLALVLAGIVWFISRSGSTSIPPPSVPIPLTSYPGTELSPTFSPDGSQVAFSWDGERQDNFDIYVKLVDRADAVRLTSDPARDSSPAWSPDGRHIAFVRDGTIFLIAPLGGAERKVADVQAFDIAWTRDARSLVVSAGKFFKRRLILLSVDTGGVKELTTAALGEEPVLGDEAPVVSPDGVKLVFVRQTTSGIAGLYLMPLAGGEPRRLTQFGSAFPGVAWTADGRELVYAGRVGDAMALWRRSVETPAGSPAKRIEGVESGAFRPVLSHPAGSPARLAYARPVFDTNISVRETTPLSPPAHRVAGSTRPDTHPQFSPDGRKLAFTSERSGSLQIWVANSDGSNPLQLTNLARGFINAPRWSPDGKVIVFTSTQNNNQDIYSVPADGGPLRRVTTAPSREGRPSWSRDGRWIYFYSNRTGRPEIWKIPAEGGEEIQVTMDGGHESFESPDGKLLYYEDYGVKGLRSVSTANSAGPREGTVVLGSVRPGYWAVAEKGIYFVELDDKSAAPQVAYYYFNVGTAVSIPSPIKFYDFQTRKITQIGVIEKGVIRGYPGFSVTWDGRYMAWSQVDQGESDLMMIENFR
jgi:Tol biopolymer transport system component/DNA-binding winged helix-turn-helix (wHTH) protein